MIMILVKVSPSERSSQLSPWSQSPDREFGSRNDLHFIMIILKIMITISIMIIMIIMIRSIHKITLVVSVKGKTVCCSLSTLIDSFHLLSFPILKWFTIYNLLLANGQPTDWKIQRLSIRGVVARNNLNAQFFSSHIALSLTRKRCSCLNSILNVYFWSVYPQAYNVTYSHIHNTYSQLKVWSKRYPCSSRNSSNVTNNNNNCNNSKRLILQDKSISFKRSCWTFGCCKCQLLC